MSSIEAIERAARIDQTGSTWAAIKEWAETQLQHERDRLEGMWTQPNEGHEHSRGRIDILKRLLDLPTPPPLEPKTADYV